MKIIIDIGHPAHVHLYKEFARIMQKNGHAILFTARDKEIAIYLLNHFNFKFINLGKPYKSTIGKLWGMARFDSILFKTAIDFKPDILLSAGSMYAAQVAWIIKKPHVTFEDTGNMEQIRLYRPFSKVILVSNVFHKDLGPKQIIYNGYHELAYLHLHYFIPNKKIYKYLKIREDEKYIILRFVSWQATHDLNQKGFNLELKKQIIENLAPDFRVLISSETKLSDLFDKYRIKIPPELVHEALSFASLYIGEGATMASECAMLGTPAIYINSITAGTLEDQEKYGLIFGFRHPQGVMKKTLELLNFPDLKDEWQKRRKRMLEDKIDVTSFLVWFVENYPQSAEIMKKDPDYQLRFKTPPEEFERLWQRDQQIRRQ